RSDHRAAALSGSAKHFSKIPELGWHGDLRGAAGRRRDLDVQGTRHNPGSNGSQEERNLQFRFLGSRFGSGGLWLFEKQGETGIERKTQEKTGRSEGGR